jgi:hypothetical protein
MGYRLKLGRAPVAALPPAARLFGYHRSLSFRDDRSIETLTKIRAAGAIATPPRQGRGQRLR